jgi:tetratricopeptide (TPR) repeat protein
MGNRRLQGNGAASVARTRLVAVLLLVVAVLSVGCATMSLMETIESLLAQAKALLDAKRYDEALAKLAEVIRRDPVQWRAYLYSAQAYIGKLDWSSAITSARKALELSPADTSVLATLGEALWGGGRAALERGAFKDAAGLFVDYIKLRPTEAQGYLNAGRAYLGSRDWTAAGRVIGDGLARISDPKARQDFARTLIDGGQQALTLGEARGAIGLLREGVKLEPRDVTAYVNLAKAYLSEGESGEAFSALRHVLELAPQNEEARRLLLGR